MYLHIYIKYLKYMNIKIFSHTIYENTKCLVSKFSTCVQTCDIKVETKECDRSLKPLIISNFLILHGLTYFDSKNKTIKSKQNSCTSFFLGLYSKELVIRVLQF